MKGKQTTTKKNFSITEKKGTKRAEISCCKEVASLEGDYEHSLVTSVIATDLGKRKHCFEMDPGGTFTPGQFLASWMDFCTHLTLLDCKAYYIDFSQNSV